MKNIVLLCISLTVAQAQKKPMQYFRYNDQKGLNVYETTKKDNTSFGGLKVKIQWFYVGSCGWILNPFKTGYVKSV